MNLYSAYDYLAYIIPGGMVVGGLQVAIWGWPTNEPSTSALVLLLGLAFIVGHLVATVAAWAQSIVWGHRPGLRPDPLWGVKGSRGVYTNDEWAIVVRQFEARYGTGYTDSRLYQLAYTDLQQQGLEGRLTSLNSQIGFARNAGTALVIMAAVHAGAAQGFEPARSTLILIPAYLVAAAVFVGRYRRTWQQFGDNVVRGFRASASRPAGA